MKTLPPIFCAWLFLCFSGGAEESAENLANQFAVIPMAQKTMANLPPGKEQEVIEALVKSADVTALLRLNHSPTVERMMKRYLDSDGKDMAPVSAFRRCGSPYLIEKLAPLLYKTDDIIPRMFGEGDSDYGESAAAAEVIGHLIMKAPEFSPEVRAWAKENLDHVGEYIIQWGRLFWETNQAELKAHKFGDVIVPGPLPDSAPSGLREIDGGRPRAPKPETAEKRKIVLEEAPPAKAPSWGIFWGILGALFILGFLLWKGRLARD